MLNVEKIECEKGALWALIDSEEIVSTGTRKEMNVLKRMIEGDIRLNTYLFENYQYAVSE